MEVEVTEPLALEEVLGAVGELLAADGHSEAIVVVGGASLALLGLVQRTTSDVDVIARAFADEAGRLTLDRPIPFPPALQTAIDTVARDFGLPQDWMNAAVAGQWDLGLPPWLLEDIQWFSYAGLAVGLVGRRTLIALKVCAAADSGRGSVHAQDLLALRPTRGELEEVASWVVSQDASAEQQAIFREVIEYAARAGE